MADDNIISIKHLRTFNANFTLKDSLEQDIKEGKIGQELAKSLSLSEAEDKVEYTLEFKKTANGTVEAVIPDDVKKRLNEKRTIQDYMVASDQRAMEIL